MTFQIRKIATITSLTLRLPLLVGPAVYSEWNSEGIQMWSGVVLAFSWTAFALCFWLYTAALAVYLAFVSNDPQLGGSSQDVGEAEGNTILKAGLRVIRVCNACSVW